MKILFANSNVAHSDWMIKLAKEYSSEIVSDNSTLLSKVQKEGPYDYIFFPHWSYIIPRKIYTNNECVVFHMTDLPKGRGGSPLQNLIMSGYTTTKVSALQVQKGLDTGPIYAKRPLSLEGSAREIFLRLQPIIEDLINRIVVNRITPKAQEGEPTSFRRRTPDQSQISDSIELLKLYDFIRMLDADGYPHAFLNLINVNFQFIDAKLEDDSTITAHVRITKR